MARKRQASITSDSSSSLPVTVGDANGEQDIRQTHNGVDNSGRRGQSIAEEAEVLEKPKPAFKILKRQETILKEVLASVQEICQKKFKRTLLCTRAKCLTFDSENLVKVMEELHLKVHQKLGKGVELHQAVVAEKKREMYMTLIQVERLEQKLRSVLLEQVMDLAFQLKKEGVIVVPPLSWDGSLGPEEEIVTNRLGFLLHACENSPLQLNMRFLLVCGSSHKTKQFSH